MRKSTGKVIVWCLLGLPAMVWAANADLPIREDSSSGEIGESGWAKVMLFPVAGERSVEEEEMESGSHFAVSLASAYMKDCLDMNRAKSWDTAWGVSDARPVEKRESVKSPEGGAAVLKTSRTGGKALRAWRGTVLPTPTMVMLIASGLVAVSMRVIRKYRVGLR